MQTLKKNHCPAKHNELGYDKLLKLPQTTASRRMVCVCDWSIRRNWTGTYLKELFTYLGSELKKGMFLKQISIGNNSQIYDSTVRFDHALKNDAMIIHAVDRKPLVWEQ